MRQAVQLALMALLASLGAATASTLEVVVVNNSQETIEEVSLELGRDFVLSGPRLCAGCDFDKQVLHTEERELTLKCRWRHSRESEASVTTTTIDLQPAASARLVVGVGLGERCVLEIEGAALRAERSTER